MNTNNPTDEELEKMTNTELQSIINLKADKAEEYRLKSLEFLDKMEAEEKVYTRALQVFQKRYSN